MTPETRPFRGQYRQDEIVDRLLGGMRHGVFVDIGAHDGVSLSNTYYFEEVRGWTGVCFEPNPIVYERLRANRKCLCENMGVGTQTGTMEFLKVSGYAEMLSGFVRTYDPRHLERINSEIAQHGGTKENLRVPVVNLSEYLNEHGMSHIDYLSVDVEGGELDIVRSLDFERIRIRVLSVENNYWDQRMRAYLRSKGYALVRVTQTDDIYGLIGAIPRSRLRESLLRIGGSLSVAGRVLERRVWG